ncbi:MAG: DedA family protein [Acidobacteria bacterium]|nr:DedA family protein [Acidobacteriota bacterium]MBI3664217.1 DedA family protein [Acidobacteriota bacterium]
MPTEAILQWVAHHAYGGVFCLLMFGIVGLPVPDELLLTYLGYLVYRGDVQFAPAIASAFLGTMCGISLSYVLGRTLGLRILHKYGKYVHVTPEMLHRAHDWFEHIGKWSLTFGYFVPGVRHLTAYVAGTAELEPHAFAAFAYTGGIFWVLTFVSLGYFLGDAWLRVLETFHRGALILTGIAAAIVILFLLVRWMRRKKI